MKLRYRMRWQTWLLASLSAIVGLGCAARECRAERPRPPFAPDGFEKLHGMVKPQDGEVLFWEIPWFLNVDDAREKAAAEGKPIVVWSGYGGAPLAVC